MKIFIVDDSLVMCARIMSLVSDTQEITLVGYACNAFDAISEIAKSKPDAVILDVRLSDGSGFRVLEYLKLYHPSILVIILTNYPYEQYRRRCSELGADFFLDKSHEFDQLVEIFSKKTPHYSQQLNTYNKELL